MYQKLLDIIAERKKTEDRITIQRAKIEKFIEIDVASLADLKIKEEKLRKEAVEKIRESGEENVTVGDKLLIPQTRITKQYNDPAKIRKAIRDHTKELLELGLKPSEIVDNCFDMEMVITDKKTIIDVVDKFEKVEGRLLDGVEEKRTEFLTIKDK